MLNGKHHSRGNPVPGNWYRFRIDVQEAGARTTIKARLWQDGAAEPADFQIDAYDDTDRRLHSGTVGVWTVGSGTRLVDSLAVTHVDLAALREEAFIVPGNRGYIQLRI